jgi:hypothetical protein
MAWMYARFSYSVEGCESHSHSLINYTGRLTQKHAIFTPTVNGFIKWTGMNDGTQKGTGLALSLRELTPRIMVNQTGADARMCGTLSVDRVWK